MTNTMKAAMAALTIAMLTACGGGGGGSVSTGGTYYTHDQLAQEFVRRVNVDVKGYDLTLVKSTTLSYDYIVVYDQDYNSYDAYWLGAYSVGDNLANYLNNNQSKFYFDLIAKSGNIYEDYVTGRQFSKIQPTTKNLSQMKALSQELAIQKSATNMRATYHMSQEKALDVARFAYKIQSSPAGTYSRQDFDAFAQDLTGSTITQFQNDYKSGNAASLKARIETAGEVTGMGAEGTEKLMKDLFLNN